MYGVFKKKCPLRSSEERKLVSKTTLSKDTDKPKNMRLHDIEEREKLGSKRKFSAPGQKQDRTAPPFKIRNFLLKEDSTVCSAPNAKKERREYEDTHSGLDTHTMILDTIIVPDTNILIGRLPFVKNLTKTVDPRLGNFKILIPWVVLEELDRLKKVKGFESTGKHAKTAIQFICLSLKNKDSKLHGQSIQLASQKIYNATVQNDDKILLFCLQYQSSCPKANVILLTEDKNMRNKAWVSKLTAFCYEEFVTFLMDGTCARPHSPTGDEQLTNMVSQERLQDLMKEKEKPLSDLNSERSLSGLFRSYEDLKIELEDARQNVDTYRHHMKQYCLRIIWAKKEYQALQNNMKKEIAKIKEENAMLLFALQQERMNVESLKSALNKKNQQLGQLTRTFGEMTAYQQDPMLDETLSTAASNKRSYF